MENKLVSVKGLLSQDNVKQKFQEILQGRAAGFTANLAIMVNNSYQLIKCDPMTVIGAAVISASLDLPLDPNLGMAAIVPYGDKAQFQIMYKGLIQLSLRSGQFKTIGVTEVFDGQLKSENPLTSDYIFDFSTKTSEKIIGYAAYFRLLNGFEKTVFWTVEKVKAHGKRYSKTFSHQNGKWNDDFDAMARKTVLKNLLNTWAPKSIEMQKAIIADQAVVSGGIEDESEFEYVDNDQNTVPPTETPAPRTSYASENEIDDDLFKGAIDKKTAEELKFNFAINNDGSAK